MAKNLVYAHFQALKKIDNMAPVVNAALLLHEVMDEAMPRIMDEQWFDIQVWETFHWAINDYAAKKATEGGAALPDDRPEETDG